MKFKVGDKVKAINNTYGWGEINKGDIGVIISNSDSYYDYIVDFPTQVGWSADKSDLELITETMTEKPQTFCINGKTHQLKAIWEDLKELGYTQLDQSSIGEYIIVSDDYERQISSLEKFKHLFSNNKMDLRRGNPEAIQFQLPQDYQKALDFAKEQLEHPYWGEKIPFEIGDFVVITIDNGNQGEVDQVKGYHPRKNNSNKTNLILKNTGEIAYENVRPATKLEIKEFTQKIKVLSHNLEFRHKGYINFGCWAIPIILVDGLIETLQNDDEFIVGMMDENLILTKNSCEGEGINHQLTLKDLQNIRKQYNLHKWS